MSELEKLHNEETTDTSYDHVLKYTGVFGGVQGLKMLTSFIRNKLTSAFLGKYGVGLISVYGSISEFLVSASNMGVPLNATQRSGELFEIGTTEEIEHFVMVVRTWVLWTALFSLLLCLCASPFLSYFFFDHRWDRFYEILLMVPVSACFLMAEGECAILKGLRQVRKVAFIEGAVAVLTLLLTVPFYYYMGTHKATVLEACGSSSIPRSFNTERGVRPTVSLAPNITFEGGSGTVLDPYVVGEIVNPEITATFYYQSSSSSGTEVVASTTARCTPSSGSCSVTIPTTVTSSVGKYNNSYAGIASNTGTMSTTAGKDDTTVSISSDTTFYATYSSTINNYYYSS